MANNDLRITVEFGGGMDALFNDEKRHSLTIPSTYTTLPGKVSSDESTHPKPSDLRYLIAYLRYNLLSDANRPDLFVQGETVRPGVLVLVNNTDWELEGELEYQLVDKDEIVFISTLHGG